MERKLLHTPEGVRDIYNRECAQKLILQENLHHLLKKYGYHMIETPTFEFFDIFSREIGTTPSKDLYKFFDREGNTLVLRPDITPSIARCAAKYYGDEVLPPVPGKSPHAPRRFEIPAALQSEAPGPQGPESLRLH